MQRKYRILPIWLFVVVAQLDAAKTRLQRTETPYNYLIDQLQAREAELKASDATLKSLRSQFEYVHAR